VRKIVINGEQWQWQVSKPNTIVIRNPENKKFITSVADINDVEPDEVYRAVRKGGGYTCAPKDIEEHIKKNILKEE